ncbi:uncharacterized protein [Nicotiana tomentosiformis]|uniref:uncharacterized protein n=1 Tax=Nicotiana tomentosiformis TaxID=4098 RepID=UPI00388C93FE
MARPKSLYWSKAEPGNERGIEVNPTQNKTIEEIPDVLTSKKEVQRLKGRIAPLGRFISMSSEKSFKFFSVLKKQNTFKWTEECQQALKNLKVYLSNPPLLAKPKDGERLLVYLAVSEMAVSAVLVREYKALDQDKNEKRLEESKGNWLEVLPGVLWAYRTTAKTGMGETPFSLVYGAEALILVEIGEPSTSFTQATEESNNEEIRMNLDLLEQRREAALIRMAAQKQNIERYYNMKAHLRYFKIGNFILKKVFQSTKTTGAGKLNPNWEGPYKI